jgi:hypothetical protein
MHGRHDRRARPDRPLRAAGLFVLTLLNSACGAGWHRPEPPPSGTLSPRQQVQVWQGGRALQWHAVRLGADSISGIPFLASPSCDRLPGERSTCGGRLGAPRLTSEGTMEKCRTGARRGRGAGGRRLRKRVELQLHRLGQRAGKGGSWHRSLYALWGGQYRRFRCP